MNARDLAKQLASLGQGRDKVLVHVNAQEAAELAQKKGGTINPHTGLPQFGLFGDIAGALTGGVAGVTLGAASNLLGGSGGKSPGSTAANSLTQLAKPLTDVAKPLVNQFQSGNLTAGDQASLAATEKSQEQQAKSLYGSLGLKDSTQALNEQQQIQNQGVQLKQNILDKYLQEGLLAYGTAFQPFEAAIKYQFDQNQQNQQDISSIVSGIFGTASSALGGGGGLFSGLFGGSGAGAAGSSLLGAGGIGGDLLSIAPVAGLA